MSSELSNLIHPLSETEFFEHYYGRSPHLSLAAKTESIPRINRESLISHLECLQLELEEDFRIARDGKWIAPMFFKAMKTEFGWIEGLLNAKWALVVKSIHQHYYPLGEFARLLGESLRDHVRINVYYSPPKAAGFGWHWDPLDLFIVQISGRKRWQVLPQGSTDESQLLIDVILEPGQVLYLPQNCRHNVILADDEPSIHLAIGYNSRFARAKQILHQRLEIWMNSPAAGLGHLTLPHNVLTRFSPIKMEETLSALDSFRESLVRTSVNCLETDPPPETNSRQLTVEEIEKQLSNQTSASSFRLLGDIRLNRTDTGAVEIHFKGGQINFKTRFRETLEIIIRHPSFLISDLPLSEMEGLAFCRVLTGAGILQSTHP